jgi:hypothetical protein
MWVQIVKRIIGDRVGCIYQNGPGGSQASGLTRFSYPLNDIEGNLAYAAR